MQWSSERIASFATATSIDDVPADLIEKVEQVVMDSIGCCIGAFSSPPVAILRAVYGNRTGSNAATVIGTDRSVPVEDAALINGAMVRYLDYNDAYVSGRSVCHPSDHVPPLIAVAQAEGATGADLIEAIVIAYEVECRGVDTGAAWENGFDYVTWGSYSTAAAAGTLMGLSHDELVDALGIAGASGNGLLVSRLGDVSMWKGVAHSYAAHNAIQACQLAGAGMSGPTQVFEGPGGFFDVVTGGPIVASFGDDPSPVMATNLKPYACGYFMQSAIEATAELVGAYGIEPGSITSIRVATFEQSVQVLGDEEKWSTDLNRETADHSIPYTTSLAVIEGAVRPEHFDRQWLKDPVIHELMSKVDVEADPVLTQYRSDHPGTVPATVTIETTDGSHSTRIDRPLGHATNPMPDEVLHRKVRALLAPTLTDEQIDGTLDACHRLDALDTMDELLTHLVI